MNIYQKINQRVNAASQKARADKGIKSDEEIKDDFFSDMIDLWNEEMAGDITLADGRKLTIPEI